MHTFITANQKTSGVWRLVTLLEVVLIVRIIVKSDLFGKIKSLCYLCFSFSADEQEKCTSV